jgi:ankyrin repeat protein
VLFLPLQMKSLTNIIPLRNTILEQINLSKIHIAIIEGNYIHFKKYLENENVIHTLDKNRCSLLHYAVFYRNISMVSALIRKKAKINFRNESGRTPLHYACDRGTNYQIALLLKHFGADPFVKDIRGYTPLDYALENKNEELFNDLCKK